MFFVRMGIDISGSTSASSISSHFSAIKVIAGCGMILKLHLVFFLKDVLNTFIRKFFVVFSYL